MVAHQTQHLSSAKSRSIRPQTPREEGLNDQDKTKCRPQVFKNEILDHAKPPLGVQNLAQMPNQGPAIHIDVSVK
jgi:hypothetical protein